MLVLGSSFGDDPHVCVIIENGNVIWIQATSPGAKLGVVGFLEPDRNFIVHTAATRIKLAPSCFEIGPLVCGKYDLRRETEMTQLNIYTIP